MRILIVEDEHLVAVLLEELLAEMGYEDVVVASDVETAYEVVASKRPDFGILDVNVGRVKVFPVAAQLSALGIPFIFCTGEPPETLPEEWRGFPTLPKPARYRDLLEALAAHAPHSPCSAREA